MPWAPIVSLFLLSDYRFTSTQVACYAEYLENSSGQARLEDVYCWTLFAISEGVGYKLQRESNVIGPVLYQSFRYCLRNARMEKRKQKYYLVCSGDPAVNLMERFKTGRALNGDRYSLTEEELIANRGRRASGTASAVYSETSKYQRVIFGEEPAVFSSAMELTDISKCEKSLKGDNAGQTECLLFFSNSGRAPLKAVLRVLF